MDTPAPGDDRCRVRQEGAGNGDHGSGCDGAITWERVLHEEAAASAASAEAALTGELSVCAGSYATRTNLSGRDEELVELTKTNLGEVAIE